MLSKICVQVTKITKYDEIRASKKKKIFGFEIITKKV